MACVAGFNFPLSILYISSCNLPLLLEYLNLISISYHLLYFTANHLLPISYSILLYFPSILFGSPSTSYIYALPPSPSLPTTPQTPPLPGTGPPVAPLPAPSSLPPEASFSTSQSLLLYLPKPPSRPHLLASLLPVLQLVLLLL